MIENSPTPGETEAAKEKPAYFIEVETGGCDHCASGRTWQVVGPGDVAESVSYESEEDAQDLADSMNDAFGKGRAHRSAEVARLVADRDEWKAKHAETFAFYEDLRTQHARFAARFFGRLRGISLIGVGCPWTGELLC